MSKKKQRLQLYAYKGNQCSACGLDVLEMIEQYGTFDRMFEFNHVSPLSKHPEYDNLIRRVISSEQLDELDKCVLLCRQCHGIVHAQNITGGMEIVVRVGNRRATQKLAGQFIVNKGKRHFTFLTSEKLLAIPYCVKVGFKQPRLMFGVELNESNTLTNLFRSLPKTKRVTIERWQNRRQLLLAEHLNDASYRVTHSVSFNLIEAELRGGRSNTPLVWVRNGLALTKDGEVTDSAEVSYEMLYSSH